MICTPQQILSDKVKKKKNGWGMCGKGRGVNKVLLGKPKGKKSLGRARHR
jgi:hypothetical protein